MHVALYSPMKPPDDPRPSGDRQAARMLVAALQRAGHRVTLASHLVSWLPAPDEDADARQRDAAAAEVDALLRCRSGAAADRPDLFLTYHLYHRAPDRLGPAVAAALRIPYVVVEASRAAKRESGPWAARFAEVDAALAAADAVAAVHAEDAEGLAAVVPPHRLHRLAPFLDTAPFRAAAAARRRSPDGVVRLLAVGMMRPGDKERSYAVLADALGRLGALPWRLAVIGDGPARGAVEAGFAAAGIGGDRLSFLGARPSEAMPAIYAEADVLVWPAINEAYGFVFLEAQAAGLPVVGARRGGVPEIVRHGETGLLADEGDATGFAAAVAELVMDPGARGRMGAAAASHIATGHDLAAGARALDALFAAAAAVHVERDRCAR
jgi:glycosyltransferase involved in cell wall biosynthesis